MTNWNPSFSITRLLHFPNKEFLQGIIFTLRSDEIYNLTERAQTIKTMKIMRSWYIKNIKECIYSIFTEKYNIKILNKTAFIVKKERITYMIKKRSKFWRNKRIVKVYSANISSLMKRKNSENANSEPDEEDKDNIT